VKDISSGVLSGSNSCSSLVNQVAKRLDFGQIRGIGCNNQKAPIHHDRCNHKV